MKVSAYKERSEERLPEEKLIRYAGARCGQGVTTQLKYGEAFRACESFFFLSMTVSEIARQYDLRPEALRNQLIGPKPEIAARYARAVEMYKHTDLSLTEIVRRCDVEERGFRSFVRRWHCDAMQERKDRRHAAHLQKISRPKGPTKAEKAEANYVPAVPLLLAGKSFKEVSQILGVSPENLCTWIKTHRPDVMEQARLGMITTPEGLRISRARYFRYQPVAAYMDIHPAEPTAEVAKRFSVPVSSLSKAVSRIFPDTWELHLKTLGGGSDK